MGGILHVMAADAEYGPCLKSRIAPLITGVGPVEAAVSVSAALAQARPDLVVSLGSAGSATLEHTGIYQASSVSYRDMDASALGFPKGLTPFLDMPSELGLEPLVPGLPTARLSTGANVVSGDAYAEIDADMVDMESYAILRSCQKFGVPLIVLRGISDGVEPLGGLESWTRHLDIIDAKLAASLDVVHAFWQGKMTPAAGTPRESSH